MNLKLVVRDYNDRRKSNNLLQNFQSSAQPHTDGLNIAKIQVMRFCLDVHIVERKQYESEKQQSIVLLKETETNKKMNKIGRTFYVVHHKLFC